MAGGAPAGGSDPPPMPEAQLSEVEATFEKRGTLALARVQAREKNADDENRTTNSETISDYANDEPEFADELRRRERRTRRRYPNLSFIYAAMGRTKGGRASTFGREGRVIERRLRNGCTPRRRRESHDAG